MMNLYLGIKVAHASGAGSGKSGKPAGQAGSSKAMGKPAGSNKAKGNTVGSTTSGKGLSGLKSTKKKK